jgi:hypothetical protein
MAKKPLKRWALRRSCGRRTGRGVQHTTTTLPAGQRLAWPTELSFPLVSLPGQTFLGYALLMSTLVNGQLALVIQDESWNVQIAISDRNSKYLALLN